MQTMPGQPTSPTSKSTLGLKPLCWQHAKGSFELDSDPASTKSVSMAIGQLPDQFVSMRTTEMQTMLGHSDQKQFRFALVMKGYDRGILTKVFMDLSDDSCLSAPSISR